MGGVGKLRTCVVDFDLELTDKHHEGSLKSLTLTKNARCFFCKKSSSFRKHERKRMKPCEDHGETHKRSHEHLPHKKSMSKQCMCLWTSKIRI